MPYEPWHADDVDCPVKAMENPPIHLWLVEGVEGAVLDAKGSEVLGADEDCVAVGHANEVIPLLPGQGIERQERTTLVDVERTVLNEVDVIGNRWVELDDNDLGGVPLKALPNVEVVAVDVDR